MWKFTVLFSLLVTFKIFQNKKLSKKKKTILYKSPFLYAQYIPENMLIIKVKTNIFTNYKDDSIPKESKTLKPTLTSLI